MMPTQSLHMAIILAAALSLSVASGQAADSRFEIDLKELPKATASHPARSGHLPSQAAKKTSPKTSVRHVATDGNVRYTVKSGDHIFKVLMRNFGLSNQQAERLIPEIARVNGIDDIRRLRVGQELLIPLTQSKRTVKHDTRSGTEPEPAPLPAQTAEPSAEGPATPPETAPSPQQQPGTALPAVPPAVSPAPEQAIAPAQQTAPHPDRPAQSIRVAVHPVPAKDMNGIVDILLDLLAPGWGRNRIVETGRESTDGSYISIKVGRYFEQSGHRYIVNSESDPLTLTMLRLLEVNGDRVINIGREEGVTAVTSRLVAKMELPRREGSFRVKCLDLPGGDFQLQGVWVSPAAPYGQQLLITGDQVPKCTAELLSGGELPLAGK
ncbi:LysM peptidoglycan-binding domain-containing protein [Geobacter argillaceus]|uniref:LysM domain-containing protein n=1 Tax=Geobacter argillaceus TaxID=345631 RepID=A0A562VM24_9BACT|nr:LysM peptidoglycan-binding domain-containing protein [Geobacter argillaceus]TWJ18969.1 LysM domain-containing protein [Geobacter argillaceus]